MIILFLYVLMIGKTPSSIRALVMFSMMFFSEVFYRKSNTLINLFSALIILLIINPFNIENIGMWLSLLGTYGIIEVYSKFQIKNKSKVKQYLSQNLILSFCVQICILPVIIYNFNTISLTFFISNILISFLIGPIIFIGFTILFLGKIFLIGNFFVLLESFLLTLVFNSASFISNLSISKLYVKTPNIIFVFIYYIILFSLLKFPSKIISSIKHNLKKIIIIITIFILISNINLKKQIQIYFIDVGQGDSTMIKTESRKIILIDGGEGHSNKYDQGENVLLPYLLDRGITKIDYIMISHFDSDHCGGLFYVIENLKVRNIIIGKQYEEYSNCKDLLNVIRNKNINLIVAESGMKIKIDKTSYFEILWPEENNFIVDNAINNNSIVAKFYYRNFSMLLTGDIEEIAEQILVSKYTNTNVLKSTILKVAHHGSKSSSIEEFLRLVQPKISIIGVGKDNKYGHPNDDVLKRLNNLRF